MSELNTQSICFIGAGNMATAIISGLISNGIKPQNITAAEPSEERLAQVKQDYGVNVETNNLTAVSSADIVVLCVKPQILKSVCEGLQGALPKNALVISIAAGVELSSLASWLTTGQPIVRCMPNTPAQVQKGASCLIANDHVVDKQKEGASALFSAVGLCSWVESEELLHSVTALSGSGPAYAFLFISAMEQAAIKQGLDANTAREFAAQTVLGAAQMVLSSDLAPEQLKKNVMSPGGTTERAIHTFEEQGLSDLVLDAMNAAHKRSIELADDAKSD